MGVMWGGGGGVVINKLIMNNSLVLHYDYFSLQVVELLRSLLFVTDAGEVPDFLNTTILTK